MLDRLQEKIKGMHGAFSVAEMLVVLLILSFLILALPPIVHKKVAKRITRGEHGRYECWRDPNDNLLYEYYATEKNGPDEKYIDPATGDVHGEQVEACHFSPKDMAPNAAYFSFQAVGGGAGGSYPIYDGSSTYQDDDYTESANVKLSTNCCSSYYSSSNTTSCWSSEGTDYYDYKYKINEGTEHEETKDGNGTCGRYTTALNRRCYQYLGSLYYYKNQQSTKNWIEKYWVPVPGTGTVKVCSGGGYTGMPAYNLITDPIPGSDPMELEYTYMYHYGGQGGEGVCWERDATTFFLGDNNRLKMMWSGRSDSDKYFYGYDEYSATKYTSWEFETAQNTVYEDWTNPSPKIELPDRYGSRQVPSVGGGNTGCGQYYAGNYATALLGADTCTVGPGYNGAAADINSEMINAEYQVAPENKGKESNTTCGTYWTKVGQNLASDGTPSFTASVTYPTFPSSIKITRKYGYDTPTMGYAGSSGVSIGMFLPKLQDDLSFEIGEGGAPGTAGDKRGGNGGNTVVKSGGTEILIANGGLGRIGGEAGNKVFMFGRDVMFGRAAVEPEFDSTDLDDIKTSPGRPAVTAVCEGLEDLDPAGDGQIDGCLDKIVARDNPKRFADQSEFYTILELDPESRTPSVINKLYGADGSNIMPGTAGDGGYNFLRTTTGKETLTYQNHPLAGLGLNQEWNYEYEFNEDYTCYRKGDQLGHATGEVVSAPDTVCKPTKGYPGAVVIVW